MTLGILKPLYPKKWINDAIVADFLKRNSSDLVFLKKKTEQDTQKKKAPVKTIAKRKVYFAKSDDEETEEDIPLQKAFVKPRTPSKWSKGCQPPKKKKQKLISKVSQQEKVPEVQNF